MMFCNNKMSDDDKRRALKEFDGKVNFPKEIPEGGSKVRVIFSVGESEKEFDICVLDGFVVNRSYWKSWDKIRIRISSFIWQDGLVGQNYREFDFDKETKKWTALGSPAIVRVL